MVHSAAETAPFTTMASAMMFGSIICAASMLAIKAYIRGDHRLFEAAKSTRSSPLDVKSLTSVYTLLFQMSVFGMILFYAYICEYHPPFPHAEKTYDRDQLFFLTAILLVSAWYTLKKNDPRQNLGAEEASSRAGVVAEVNDSTEVLNRDQTEEWKGWMQFMFLLYHYYHAGDIYNAIRIMITCYVWMTGFGNFSFFYLKGDYGSVRVMQMLWRLNFLVIFLCLTQGTTYILYYICLLHTYFFGLVYLTMRIASHTNYTKWGLRIKLAGLALVIYVIWDVDNGLFKLIHSPFLDNNSMLGAPAGSMWEWYFRSSLDHWSTLLGMVFALNFPITSLFFRKLEAQPMLKHYGAKAVIGAFLLFAMYSWVRGPFQNEKLAYNATNAYFGCIPLLVYIYFRNLTPWLRSHSLDLLHQIGKTTLETYLMQHHIWLTSDAKTLLTLIPGWPKMNFILVSVIYVLLSRRLYTMTLFLRGMLLPNDRNTCLRNVIGLLGAINAFLGLAWVLKLFNCLNLTVVGLCSMICGVVIYHVTLSLTGSRHLEGNPEESQFSRPEIRAAAKFMSTGIGTFASAGFAVLCIGLTWNHMAVTGAAKVQPLPPTCAAASQTGGWIPIDGCMEDARGYSYRTYDVAGLGTCSAKSTLYNWGWKKTPSNSYCRLVYRDPGSLKKLLHHRNITFVGDSIVRHVYHASRRQFGDAAAGAYNSTLTKQSDFSHGYGTTAFEFRWSPYADEIKTTLDAVAQSQNKPHLVVAGGGAWDLLHRYSTPENKTILHDQVGEMVTSMRKLQSEGVPVVWVVPTTINTWALTTDQKKENMREDQMVGLRAKYAELGVHDAATYVLDGPTFTKERVGESYDGVHYPFTVYDGGAQILANAYDWLLPEAAPPDPKPPPHPGKMANSVLGLLIVGFVFIGVFLFDGFMGVSYLVVWLIPDLMPNQLFDEAFATLHEKKKLPPMQGLHYSTPATPRNAKVAPSSKPSDMDGDEEGVSLMQTNNTARDTSV